MTKADLPTHPHPIAPTIGKAAFLSRWLAGVVLALGTVMAVASAAQAETRSLKLYFVHTKERAEITFKRNGRYDQAGLKKINTFLRDWRRNEPTKMDPRLLDAVWETYRAVGAKDYIHVVSAYRSPATNSMLRKRSSGVAQKSQHMLGKAMDFYIPGVPLQKLRDAGLRAQAGGVGYYPRSGSPFIHMDVGNVRHWPRMSRKELVAVFPKGGTLHVPTDGKPLPGFDQALASYEARKKNGTTALALASASSGKSGRTGGLLAALFGGGADEEEDNGESAVMASAPPPKPAAAKAAPARAKAARPPAAIQVVPPELANPATVPFQETVEDETPQMILAALPERDIPTPLFAPRPKAEVAPAAAGELALASVEPAEPGNIPFAMASALPAEGPDEDVAVPLPSWRPAHEEGTGTMLALAPVPEERPVPGEDGVAGLIATSEEGDIAAARIESEQRLAALAQSAELDDVAPRGARVASLADTVRTTAKSDRARTDDGARAQPKPQVVAAEPDAARWALGADAPLAYASDGPAVGHVLVRSTPSEVYATGFRRDTVVADASRFSGKAVSFMPVARFQTN